MVSEVALPEASPSPPPSPLPLSPSLPFPPETPSIAHCRHRDSCCFVRLWHGWCLSRGPSVEWDSQMLVSPGSYQDNAEYYLSFAAVNQPAMPHISRGREPQYKEP